MTRRPNEWTTTHPTHGTVYQSSDWPAEKIDALRALWAEGHSTPEIGRRLGVTKNAIIGKAHRLDLPARESPIIRTYSGEKKPRQAPRATGPTLPPLPSAASEPVYTAPECVPAVMVPPPAQRRPEASQAPSVPYTIKAAPAKPLVAPVRPVSPLPAIMRPLPIPTPPARPTGAARGMSGRIVECCWPIGDPGTRGFRFCGDRSKSGKPYCAPHCEIAYVRVRDRREDAL